MADVNRVVVFGATGYTGELTARALVARGVRPLLAGRRREAIEPLASDLGGLEVALADATRPETVRALVERGDVLVTTVGPMMRWGDAALDAAIDAGADYVDSSGESSFVRRVFDAGPRAAAAGVRLLPAMGYDSVPGNLAGALALREAGPAATRLRIGYFVSGARRGGLRGGLDHMSGGSRATFTAMAIEPGFAWRGGRLVPERGSARVGAFTVDGERRRGVSFGTSESLALPRAHPDLEDVEVYFGWFDSASRMLQIGSLLLGGPLRVPGVRPRLRAALGRFIAGSSGGPRDPSTGSVFVAEALDGEGAVLASVTLAGINGYEFTGEMLAWTAARVAAGEAQGTGALGPTEAFDLEQLEAGVAECGIRRGGSQATPLRAA